MARKLRPLPPKRTSLISDIEIGYFRNFYKVQINDLADLNIIFGENDTGKSNVMRALNLFFNQEVSDGYDFDFDVDLSRRRAREAEGEGDIRRFSYVKLWFRTPENHSQALGEQFYVKRQWSQATIPGYRQETSKHIASDPYKQQSLTKLLSKIKFTYIPAVKSRSVYEELLENAYNAIARGAAFKAALQTFTDEIQRQTLGLSQKLNKSLGMESAIAPPTDLAELFASLDFETLIAGQESMSLIRQRGDGVQARHIPEILSFIAENDEHQHHLLAIEEPENSLSVQSALQLGNRIQEIATKDSLQTYITTHSPTFYTLSGEQVKKFFLKNNETGDLEVRDGTSSTAEELLSFMGDNFYLPLIAKSVVEAEERANHIAEAFAAIESKLDEQNKPILFVEGPSDLAIMAGIAAELIEAPDRFEIVSLEGVSHAERLSTMPAPLVQKLLGDRKGFVLLDADGAGRSALSKTVDQAKCRSAWQTSANGIHWRLLPATTEAEEAFRSIEIPESFSPGMTIEDMYSAEVRGAALAVGNYELGPERDFVRTKANLFLVSPALTDDKLKFYLLKPGEIRKTAFAQWLIQTGQVANDHLGEVLSSMIELI